ncbi:c-type cytochrome [Alteromonas lipolytica]|uniref:Cytochrome C oxidase Cbb3 n=1 Tax=Alteromonas lipolytica TaxID=1856405 RepID=A0A1E8F8V9_9ALTE|nr:cytochrome c [Alteromonas lipolytica]OFI32354.1 cytochrome C oxidase Cbb3 [Alteromonas lipolytica]GGF86376.1 hypothetical protein GCM10011338_43460 [Alteromonas lipolytica]
MKIAIKSLLAASLVMVSTSLLATDDAGFSLGNNFEEVTGEALYHAICQGCHMPNAQGAKGAGMYPALAGNPKLGAAPYVIFMVSNGMGGMPALKQYLSDEQIAEVVNYTRSHFGNHFTDVVNADDVKTIAQR